MLQVHVLFHGNIAPVRHLDDPGHAGDGQERAIVLIMYLESVLVGREQAVHSVGNRETHTRLKETNLREPMNHHRTVTKHQHKECLFWTYFNVCVHLYVCHMCGHPSQRPEEVLDLLDLAL